MKLLNKKIGNRVRKNEVLFTIYAEKKQKLKEAARLAKRMNVFSLFNQKKTVLIEEI